MLKTAKQLHVTQFLPPRLEREYIGICEVWGSPGHNRRVAKFHRRRDKWISKRQRANLHPWLEREEFDRIGERCSSKITAEDVELNLLGKRKDANGRNK